MGMYNLVAVAATTYRPDSDGDGLPDTREAGYALNPRSPTGTDGATGDPDQDGLTIAWIRAMQRIQMGLPAIRMATGTAMRTSMLLGPIR